MTPSPSPVPAPGDTGADYAAAVVRVLREHFEDLNHPAVAVAAADAIDRQTRDPQASFEFIVDDPRRACWRLKPDSRDRRRVRLAYFPVIPPGSESRRELERTVNEALEGLTP